MGTYMTTTDLRRKTPQLVQILSQGGTVSLVHRSKVIGTVKPVENNQPKPVDIEAFKKALAALRPIKIIPRRDRERIYRKHLEEKYGKGIS